MDDIAELDACLGPPSGEEREEREERQSECCLCCHVGRPGLTETLSSAQVRREGSGNKAGQTGRWAGTVLGCTGELDLPYITVSALQPANINNIVFTFRYNVCCYVDSRHLQNQQGEVS